MSNFILSATGKRLDPRFPDPDQIDLIDIAIGLAKERRFRGFTKQPYNVAQHSCMAAEMLATCFQTVETGASKGDAERYVQAALLHDASEAYLGDIINPIKQLLPDYKELEKTWMRAIATRFDVDFSIFEASLIKLADTQTFWAEVHFLCGDCTDYGLDYNLPKIVEDLVSRYPILKSIQTPWDETFSSNQFLGLARYLNLE